MGKDGNHEEINERDEAIELLELEPIDGIHVGRNFKRLRMAAKVKQEVIAQALNKSQQSITRLEERPIIDDETLDIIAPLIGCSVEIIKNLREEIPPERLYQFYGYSTQNINFNPLDKLIEFSKDKDDLHKEKFDLLIQVNEETKKNNAEMVGFFKQVLNDYGDLIRFVKGDPKKD